jgi:subtilase family serine protease
MKARLGRFLVRSKSFGLILSLLAVVFLVNSPGDASGGSSSRELKPNSTALVAGQVEMRVVSPTDPEIIFASSDTGRISKSTDGGRQWKPLSQGLPPAFYRRTYAPLLAMMPGPREVVYALIGYPVHSGLIENRLYRSLDEGEHWREVKRLPDNWIFESLRLDSERPRQLTLKSDNGELVIEDSFDMALADGQNGFDSEVEEIPWRAATATSAPAQSDMDVGNIAVLHDDGSFLEIFDLSNRTLEFSPNGSGGYSVSFIGFSFDSNLGNRQTLNDDDSRQVSLPFNFPFYGINRTTLFVNSNGNVTFNSGDTDSTPSVAEFVTGGSRIAALWHDFNPATTTSPNGVYVRTTTSGGSRAIITWSNVPEFNTTNSNTFQLTLFSDGRIRMSYQAIASKDGLVGISNGGASSFFRVNFDQDLPASFPSATPILELFDRGLNTRVVARRFYQSHPDSFDFLVIFGSSTFPNSLAGPANLGFTEIVRNDVSGIGLQSLNNTSAFGSAGRLQSVVVMNRLSDFPNDPNDQIGHSTLSALDVLGQAVGHRWGAFVRFNDNGSQSFELLGRGLANWSFFHDTDASYLEGNNWLDLGSNTFRSDNATTHYSALDQYLMGLRSSSEVPDFFIISSPSNAGGRDRTSPPEIGVTVNGIRRTISINQIISIEGSRFPAPGGAPNTFMQAFVLIVPQGEDANQADLTKLDNVRQNWETTFRTATDSRGAVLTQLMAAGPDLVVEGLTVTPTTVNPGSSVSVSFSIANRGTQTANSTFHEIRLSSDTTINNSDTLLTTVATPTLSPGQSVTFTNLILTIPSNTPTGTQYLGIIADAPNGVAESNEGNNTASVALSVGSALPDLVVASLTVNPSSAAPGSAVNVSFTILNQGGGTAASTTHDLRLSPDSFIDSTDTLLTTVGTPSLPPGGSQAFSNLSVTIPSNTSPGSWFIGVRADAGGLVAESNEGNNTSTFPITVLSPLPDFIVSDLSVNPTSANPGGTVTVSFSIVNQGTATAAGTAHSIYLSPDNTITTGDTFLTSVGTGSLSPGASQPFSLSVVIPSSTPSGSMFIGVIADVTGQVNESNESNNTAATPITINVPVQPDLVVINLSVTPNSTTPGSNVTLSFAILNQGNGTASGTAHNIYLSADSNITTSDTFLTSLGTGSLSPGASQSFSQTVTIPSSTPVGSMFIGVIADATGQVSESNEANNTAATPITITAPVQPDLVVINLSVTPNTAAPGSNVTVSFSILNQGNGTAGGTGHNIYLSVDSNITTSDTFLTSVGTGTLNPGASQSFSQIVTIPISTPTGSMFIGVIADVSNLVNESNESNNTSATSITITAPAQADLVVTNLTINPTSADAGDSITVSFTILNQGSGSAAPASHDIRFSNDTTIDITDTLLATTITPGLAPGASAPMSQSVTIPTTATQGAKFIGVIADAGNAVNESNESNNTASTPITITSVNETEPNNTNQAANPITPNVDVIGTINPAGDEDFFSFVVNGASPSSPKFITIDIDAQTLNPPSPLDSVVTLYFFGSQVAENDNDGSSLDSRVTFIALVSGSYSFRVRDKNAMGGANYKYKAKVTVQ